MKKLFPLLFVAVFFISCNNKSFTIEGTLENGAGKVIYIEELTPDEVIFLDSITLDSKGSFCYKYKMPYKTFYNLHVSEYDYVVLLPDEGETISIKGDYANLQGSYMLKGAGESQLLWQLQDYTNDGISTLLEIGATEKQNKQLLAEGKISEKEYDAAHQATDSIYMATYLDQQNYVFNFIEENMGSLATIIALYKPFNVNHPLVNPEVNFEYYDLVLQGLEESLPENPHTLNFKNTVEHLRYNNGM